MWRMERIVAVGAAVAGLLTAMVVFTPVVSAKAPGPPPNNPSCGTTYHQQVYGWIWDPSGSQTADGIRAPIFFRRDGLLCNTTDSAAFNWIGIANPGGSAGDLVQIGFEHLWAGSNIEYCRFYEDPGSFPTAYSCSATDDLWYFFRIEIQNGGYVISDCGTGGDFSNCTPEDSYSPTFSTPEAQVGAEAHESCVTQIMGTSASQVTYGNSNWHITVKDNGTWSRVSWTFVQATCSGSFAGDYAGSGYSDGLETWDTRNTS